MTDPAGAAARITALSAQATVRAWSLDGDIDWRRPVKRPWWLSTRAYVDLLSQLYHAERAASAMCGRLASLLPEAAARRFLTLQQVDESRHIAAYESYLGRLGDIAPVNEAVAMALDGAGALSPSPLAAIVAFHVVLEGEAVRLQQDMCELFPCPLLAELHARISRDEARHVAFGRLYLRERLPRLPGDERRDIYKRVKALWRICAEANRGAAPLPVPRGKIDARWRRQRRALIDVGLVDESEAE